MGAQPPPLPWHCTYGSEAKPANVVISASRNAVLIDVSGERYTHNWLAPEMRELAEPEKESFERRV